MSARHANADLSLELAHAISESSDSATVRAQVDREVRFVRPLLDNLREQGLIVSTCALLDDSGDAEGTTVEARELLASACRDAGLEIDYFVNGSTLVDTLTTLDPYFYPEIPPESDGVLGTSRHVPTVDPVIANERWLENGEPGRDHPLPDPLRLPVRRSEDAAGDVHMPQTVGARSTRMHAIHLDVELWSQQRRRGLPGPILWSLPMLASWWQLLRLGAPATHGGFPLAPEPTHPESAPFSAYATLTVLPSAYLPVEHAVRTILSRVAIPSDWLVPSTTGSAPDPLEHLNRINYVFTAEMPKRR